MVMFVGTNVDARVGTAIPAPIAASCASHAFTANYDPARGLKILEYAYAGKNVPAAVPTGRVLGFMDETTRQIASFCHRTRPRGLPKRGQLLAGPYPRGSAVSRVFCMKVPAVWDLTDAGRTVEIEMRPLLNRAKRQVGNRLIASIDSIPVFTASVTRRNGSYAFDYMRCMRNPSF
jgi:hypothetical protein